MRPLQTEQLKRVTRARTQLLLDQPFFGSAAMHLELVETRDFPTLAVDGTRLFFNPDFTATLPDMQLVFGVAHEVLHCVLGHPYRKGTRNHVVWNVATDYAINQILVDSGFLMIPGGLLNSDYTGMSSEAIYAKLVDQQAKQQQQGGAQGNSGTKQGDQTGGNEAGTTAEGIPESMGSCPTGEVLEAPSDSTGKDNTAEDWKVATDTATAVAAKAGKLPANLKKDLEASKEQSTDWVALLREFVQRLSPSNYSWSRPNRRMPLGGLYLPSLDRTRLGTVAVAIDTSGSVSDELYKKFKGELDSILNEAQPERVVFLQCDTRVNFMEDYEPGDDVQVSRKGYGGTKFQPVFDSLEKRGESPAALIYFTDLEPSDRPTEPDYPVLWVAPQWARKDAPFGRVAKI